VLFFANPTGSPKVHEAMRTGRLGCIVTPKQGNKIPEGATICADNGLFGKGYPGDSAWYSWLAGLPAERCAFAVAPDVPFDAIGTLDKSLPWLGKIRELGIPAALAAQDGLEDLLIPWDAFDVFFIAGSTEWKIGPAARALTVEAKRRGKQVHMGRVNSGKRFRYAHYIGCDSADGTYLVHGPDINLPKLLGWVRGIEQDQLFGEAS
jgi:hypothetical protein